VKYRRSESQPLDPIDAALVTALADDARISVAELARIVEMSPPSVSERLKRLEEAGIIRGYTVRIDPAALGRPIVAWLRVKPLPGKLEQVAEILRGLPDVIECDRITGEDCFLARACVPTMQALERMIDKIIPYASTNTSIVQSSPVERRLPPVRPAAG
jgi:Lrp/AsnC family transcriptional regulator, leucine-responsive regulatory protein